jgi:hypothetical protein
MLDQRRHDGTTGTGLCNGVPAMFRVASIIGRSVWIIFKARHRFSPASRPRAAVRAATFVIIVLVLVHALGCNGGGSC